MLLCPTQPGIHVCLYAAQLRDCVATSANLSFMKGGKWPEKTWLLVTWLAIERANLLLFRIEGLCSSWCCSALLQTRFSFRPGFVYNWGVMKYHGDIAAELLLGGRA